MSLFGVLRFVKFLANSLGIKIWGHNFVLNTYFVSYALDTDLFFYFILAFYTHPGKCSLLIDRGLEIVWK